MDHKTTFFTLILVITSASASIVDSQCSQELGEDGWRCIGGTKECVPTEWLCDGFPQCSDDSDEGKGAGEGCNLFPDSQCLSYQGKQHFKCEIAGKPTQCLPSREEAEQCEAGAAPKACEEGKWRCGDGRCILGRLVCDGTDHCEDGSDERTEALYGCNRYNNSCKSWGGMFYERCPAMDSVCTIPELASLGNASVCRDCLDDDGIRIEDLWRCNNGICINSTLRNDGRPDCEDGSDEDSTGIYDKWPAILLSAIFITLIGLGLSFLCRYINVWNPTNCFSCDLCSSSRKKHVSSDTKWYAALPKLPLGPLDATDNNMEVTQAHEQDQDEDDQFYRDSDIPIDLIKYFDDRAAFWTHQKTTQQENHSVFLSRLKGFTLDRPQISSPIMINEQYMPDARRLYALLHNDPVKYHHLYMYLAYRASTVRQLNKVSNILLDWEKDLHNLQNLEVLKCWRLHLGSSELTAKIVNSVADAPTFCSRLDNTCYPARNFFRRMRRMCFQVKINQDYWVTRVIKTFYFLLYPFVQASLFYLEMIKQMMFVYIFMATLNNLSKNNPTKYPFELGMIVAMIIMIIVIHILFAVYAVIFCEDIFEIGHSQQCKSKIIYVFKGVAALMGLVGIMPVYVLANHVHYKVKQDMRIRHLQTHQFDDDESDDNPGTFVKMEQNRDDKLKERINIYKEVCKFETKANFYGKLYNHYRVTSAVLGSMTLLVVLVLLLFVTGRHNREIKLVDGVEQQLKDLFHSLISSNTPGANLTEELKLVKDMFFGVSMITSLLAVVTALTNYWYLAKNLALSWAGQVIIGCYLTCMVVNRLTTYISVFAITQPVQYDTGVNTPKITLVPAVFIFCFLCIIQVVSVYLYKRKYSKGWYTGTKMDQWINVLINSMVVIPFMAQKDHLQILKQKEGVFEFSPEKKRRASLNKRGSILRMDSEVDHRFGGNEIATNASGVPMLGQGHLVAPFIYDDLRRMIQQLWWKNPTRKLRVEDVCKHLQNNKEARGVLMLLSLEKGVLDMSIQKTLYQLEVTGLINLPLLNPIPTKREYFWLFFIVVIQNIVALIIEVATVPTRHFLTDSPHSMMVNGGVWTADGHYYSWDVRLATLLLGLVFLIMYYKKYHVLRDLTTNRVCGGWLHHLPVCLCCVNDVQLSAPANEEAISKMLSGENTPIHRVDGGKVILREIQTQTSISGLYRPHLAPNDRGDMVPSAPPPDGDLQEVVVVKDFVKESPSAPQTVDETDSCVNTSPQHSSTPSKIDKNSSYTNATEKYRHRHPPSSLPVKSLKNGTETEVPIKSICKNCNDPPLKKINRNSVGASNIEMDDIPNKENISKDSTVSYNSSKSTLDSPDVKPQVHFSPERKPSVVTAL